MLGPVEKRLLTATAILLWLCLLVVHVLTFVISSHPETPTLRPLAQKNAHVNRAKTVLAPLQAILSERLKPFQNLDNPFYVNPAQPPPPSPPPVVRQLDLLYQGSIVTSVGDRKAFLKSGDQSIVGGIGTKVSAYFTIAEISPRTLSLRDPAGKTTVLEFSVQKSVAIPIQ